MAVFAGKRQTLAYLSKTQRSRSLLNMHIAW